MCLICLVKMLGYVFNKLKIKYIFLLITCSFACLYVIQIFLVPLVKDHEKGHPIIIWWTPLMAENEQLITCSKYTCLSTKNRNYVNNTHLQAFLFYGSSFDIKDLPETKNKIWALFHEESPRNVALFWHQRTYDLFNITATFSRHSDLPLTLQYLDNISIITDTRYFVNVKEKNKLKSIAPVLYIQSDCDTPIERDTYVKELMKYIQVDSFGECLNNKKFPAEISGINPMDFYNEDFLHFIAQYKFIIAFENAICEDYITEKLWRPLLVGAIPIYLGSPSVRDWLPNANSAILAKDFISPEKLAGYVNRINANDTLYETFLEHKFGKIENELLKDTLAKGSFGIEMDQGHPISGFECFVCQQIHEGVQKSTLRSVYDCAKPIEGNSWEYFWKSGDCQSKALVNLVKNNVNTVDVC